MLILTGQTTLSAAVTVFLYYRRCLATSWTASSIASSVVSPLRRRRDCFMARRGPAMLQLEVALLHMLAATRPQQRGWCRYRKVKVHTPAQVRNFRSRRFVSTCVSQGQGGRYQGFGLDYHLLFESCPLSGLDLFTLICKLKAEKTSNSSHQSRRKARFC